jgi:hypothetical protein
MQARGTIRNIIYIVQPNSLLYVAYFSIPFNFKDDKLIFYTYFKPYVWIKLLSPSTPWTKPLLNVGELRLPVLHKFACISLNSLTVLITLWTNDQQAVCVCVYHLSFVLGVKAIKYILPLFLKLIWLNSCNM